MSARSWAVSRPTVRLAVYVGILAVILIFKGPWGGPGSGPILPLANRDDTTTVVTVRGIDLAPVLVPRLVESFREQYPVHEVLLETGGTAHALEALANGKASVALLYREPSDSERAIIFSARGDSVAAFPVALGGILLLGRRDSGLDSLTLGEVRAFLRGEASPFERLYAPDPNQGLWSVFCEALGVPQVAETIPGGVTFMADDASVSLAVTADPRAVGLASSLVHPQEADVEIRPVPVRSDTSAAAVAPTYEAIGYGRYPLYHYLYAACLPYRNLAAGKFVTYLTSDRGQRAVEREGFLPARRPLWEIQLSQRPLGSE